MDLIRKDILLAPVNSELRSAVVDEGWFHDDPTNWKLGFGKGLVGRKTAVETFQGFLQEQRGQNRGLVGLYRNGEPAGFVFVSYLGDSSKTVDLFYFISPRFRKAPGVATSGLLKALDRLFQEKDVFRVQIELLTINKDAIHFLRKLGFAQEGIRRSAYWMGLNSFNMVTLRMLKPDWKRNGVRHAA